MKYYILTKSLFKKNELDKYFLDSGIPIIWIKNIAELDVTDDYFLFQEQTKLINEKSENVFLNKVEKCFHISQISVIMKQGKEIYKSSYTGEVEGFIFPSLKNKNKDYQSKIYSWDDVFVPINSILSNQNLKEIGLKNSARDIAFSKFAEDFEKIFTLDKQMNLNFNPVKSDSVINFEPIIFNLLRNNEIYSQVYNNNFFKPLLNKVLNNGLFVRKAKTRSDRNYWLPGVNAGIPLTPKKDNIHELTFMFHDIMHFLFPDFILTGKTQKDKNIYIISRMMSEAFTIIMADFLFIDILKKSGVKYDFTMRKIYPLFEGINIDISNIELDKLKEILYKNALFVLFGKEEELKKLTKNDTAFLHYKEKYQNFFREDYIWTKNNADHFFKYADINKEWDFYVKDKKLNFLQTTSSFQCGNSVLDIFNSVFEHFFLIIENSLKNPVEYSPILSYKNAYKSYLSGQLMIFFNLKNLQYKFFIDEIESLLVKIDETEDLNQIRSIFEEIVDIYSTYIDSLVSSNLLNKYKGEQYKNIYPMFEPFYVFYDKKEKISFQEVLKNIFI